MENYIGAASSTHCATAVKAQSAAIERFSVLIYAIVRVYQLYHPWNKPIQLYLVCSAMRL